MLARRHSLNLEKSTPLVHDRRTPPERRTALQAGQTAPAADRPPRTAFAGHCPWGRSAATAEAGAIPYVPVLEYGTTKWIYRNITPLTLDISAQNPKRVNLLLATINFDYVFAGYIGMFNMALRLRREGYRTRIILHENTEWDLESWRTSIQKYSGLTTLFDEVEDISRWDRTIPVESNPDDRFVATNCWAAHVAHHTARNLNEKRFLFMAQEYEPFFMAMNSISALFQQAYTFPQVTLFSTELLQEFFQRERIGVFAKSERRGGCDCLQQCDPGLPPDTRSAHPAAAACCSTHGKRSTRRVTYSSWA